MGLEIKGLVYRIGATEVVSEKFSKREIIIHVASEYPQYLSLQLTQTKCALADNLKVGQEINCHLNLRGKFWVDPKTNVEKCFNTLEVWKIDAAKIETPNAGTLESDLAF